MGLSWLWGYKRKAKWISKKKSYEISFFFLATKAFLKNDVFRSVKLIKIYINW
jgi:hypothetical protein